MAGRNRPSFLKRQKERKRQENAAQKMARRQGKTEGQRDSEDLQDRPDILINQEFRGKLNETQNLMTRASEPAEAGAEGLLGKEMWLQDSRDTKSA